MTTIYINERLELSPDFDKKVAASIGFFDGVHRGHRFLISQLKAEARKAGLPSAVITFPIHPRKVLHTDYQPDLLNSFEEKLHQLSTTGVDYCFVLNFTRDIAEIPAKEFIRDYLSKKLNVEILLIGYDHKFGKGRTDGFEQYRQYGESCGMKVIQADSIQEKDIHISSTTIRKLLIHGKVKEAAQILSYNYMIEGIVVDGNKMGREMGYPTANIELEETGKIIPQDGVYATWVYIDGKKYKGMTYIGNRPSLFLKGEKRIETNLLDFEGDLYGKKIGIEFIHHIRHDRKFGLIEELQRQLDKDMKITRQLLE